MSWPGKVIWKVFRVFSAGCQQLAGVFTCDWGWFHIRDPGRPESTFTAHFGLFSQCETKARLARALNPGPLDHHLCAGKCGPGEIQVSAAEQEGGPRVLQKVSISCFCFLIFFFLSSVFLRWITIQLQPNPHLLHWTEYTGKIKCDIYGSLRGPVYKMAWFMIKITI